MLFQLFGFELSIGRPAKRRVRTPVRAEVMQVLRLGQKPLRLRDIMEALAKRKLFPHQSNVAVELKRMEGQGFLRKPGRGLYQVTEEGMRGE
jgi:repressor of nif and glnA expression